MSCVTSLINS